MTFGIFGVLKLNKYMQFDKLIPDKTEKTKMATKTNIFVYLDYIFQ